jgi:hypothetical protein
MCYVYIGYILYMYPSIYTHTHVHRPVFYPCTERPLKRSLWCPAPHRGSSQVSRATSLQAMFCVRDCMKTVSQSLMGQIRPLGHVAVNCCSESLPPGSTICRHNDAYQVAGSQLVISPLDTYQITGMVSAVSIVLNFVKHDVSETESDSHTRC